MLGNLVHNALRWSFLGRANDLFGSRRIDGTWWTIYLLSGTEEDEKRVRGDLLRAPPADLAQLVDSDLGVRRETRFKIPVLFLPAAMALPEFLERVGASQRICRRVDDGGLYHDGMRLVLLTGEPETDWFRRALLHELAHAYCHCFHGLAGRIPWAREGYAESLVNRTLALSQGCFVSHLQRDLDELLPLIDSNRLTPTRELMMLSERSWMLSADRYPAYYPHCALLVHFLMHMSSDHVGIPAVFRRAIGEKRARPAAIVERLERSINARIEHLDANFVEFCKHAELADLEFRFASKWPSTCALSSVSSGDIHLISQSVGERDRGADRNV